ncbi:hypothetical protein ACRAWD_18210 [Caulobacter segnis]
MAHTRITRAQPVTLLEFDAHALGTGRVGERAIEDDDRIKDGPGSDEGG